MKLSRLFSILFLLFFGTVTYAQEMPKLIEKDGRYALLVDGEPFMMLGGQSSNSSTWPEMLPDVWNVMKTMHANTLEIPIYWEQFEPEKNKYDYSIIQMVLDQARQNNIRLVLLWFATWKNGSNHYMPQWMKKDSKKYPNVIGDKGQSIDSPSPHSKATMEADAKAFVEFMKYLKTADPQHTVIMVQVENEPGTWESVRDYSSAAEKLFKKNVPETLLNPKILKQLNVSPKVKGTWSEVFGERADEYFHAWHVASYIDYIAAAGKEVNPLPMYVNVALRDPLTNPMANHYESGGATDNVIPIWKAAAPSIDLLAPDIYLRDDKSILKVIDLYSRPDNALFVPETGANTRYLYEIISKGIGFSPFGVDGRLKDWTSTPLSKEYELLAPMSKQLAKWNFEGKIVTVLEPEEHTSQKINLGNWEVLIIFSNQRKPADQQKTEDNQPLKGKAMIVKLNENEFMIVGTNCRISFNSIGKNKGRAWQYLHVTEGRFENNEFKLKRILNGDQTDWGGPYIGDNPSLLHIELVAR